MTYMVTAHIPELTDDMIDLIPDHRARVNGHMLNRRIIGYTLAADRSMPWIVILADTLEKADDIMQSLPLTPYLNYTIHETVFHEVIPGGVPAISQN